MRATLALSLTSGVVVHCRTHGACQKMWSAYPKNPRLRAKATQSLRRLPETKDRTFAKIDMLFEQKASARKFEGTKVNELVENARAHGKNADEVQVQVDQWVVLWWLHT